MKNRIITISREFGSGGRTIGKEVAKQLEIPCYDEEILNKVATESGFSKEYIKNSGEYAPSGNWFTNALSGRDYTGHSFQDDLWNIQRNVILQAAEAGACVIVGRCADYILKDMADCLTVFIHASLEKRADRIVNVYGETEIPANKRLIEKDKRRKAYYQIYTDRKWGDIRNYDIALDSGTLGINKCVDILADIYKSGNK